MNRVYATRLLKTPKLISLEGQRINVRALQIPIPSHKPTKTDQKKIETYLTNIEKAFMPSSQITEIQGGRGRPILYLKDNPEKQPGREEFTLVYDEKDLFPACNFQNNAVNNARIISYRFDPDASPQQVAETQITLLTTGPKHFNPLVNLQNQGRCDFLIDQLDVFYPFLQYDPALGHEYMKDKDIREFTKFAFARAFTQFFIIPSSASGKYHSADEIVIQGLVIHSKRVAWLAFNFAKDWGCPRDTLDKIFSAGLLHDIDKYVEKDENGNFRWCYQYAPDHGVLAKEWLEKLIDNEFPHLKEKLQPILNTVLYHMNIWVDSFNTALGPDNAINDYAVTTADIIAGLPNVRVHYPGEKETSPEEAINSVLDRPFELEVEQKYKNWQNLTPEQKKAVFIAYALFKNFEVAAEEDKTKVIEAILKGNIPDQVDPSQDRLSFIIKAASLVPNMKGIDIYFREDINGVIDKIEKPSKNWTTPETDPLTINNIAHDLKDLLFSKPKYDLWAELKKDFLEKINHTLRTNRIKIKELSDELLLALMQKFGTIDTQEIYIQIYALWKNKEEIRETLQNSKKIAAVQALAQLDKIISESPYSDKTISEIEECLRERFNKTLEEADKLKPIDPSIKKMLSERYGEKLAGIMLQEIEEADQLKYERFEPRRVLTRINSHPEVKKKIGEDFEAFKQELETLLNESSLKEPEALVKEINELAKKHYSDAIPQPKKDKILEVIESAQNHEQAKRKIVWLLQNIYAGIFDSKARRALLYDLECRQRHPFNHLNKDIIGWLMKKYHTSKAEELFYFLNQPEIIKILKKYEEETKKLEVYFVGNCGKSAIPEKNKKKLLEDAEKELKPLLPPPPPPSPKIAAEEKELFELKYLAQFLAPYGLTNAEKIENFLDFPRKHGNYKDYSCLLNYDDHPKVPALAKARDLLVEKLERIDQGEKIMHWGDFDADGFMSTYISQDALPAVAEALLKKKGYSNLRIKQMISDNIHFHIPERLTEGYGLHEEGLRKLIDDGFTVLITSDCGISNKEEIASAKEYARQKGKEFTIIVTDHHSIPQTEDGKYILPEADAIVHPKLLREGHPASDISGTAVIEKTMRSLFEHPKVGLEMTDNYVVPAVIATIADVVPMGQHSENRAYAYFGSKKFNRLFRRIQQLEIDLENLHQLGPDLESSKQSEIEEQIKKLFKQTENLKNKLPMGLYLLTKALHISVFDRDQLGFGLVPKWNAIGRLGEGEAGKAVKLLLIKDKIEALRIIKELIKFNEKRKVIQAQITEEALAQLEERIKQKTYDSEKDRSIVLTDENWHRGVVGIVASRIASHIKGIAALGTARGGSARSIPGFHIMKILRKAAELYQEDTGYSLFEKYGGHAGAAGYRLKRNVPKGVFELYVKRAVEALAAEDKGFKEKYGEKENEFKIDAYLPVSCISKSFCLLIKLFGPFGRQTYGETDEVASPIWGTRGLKVVDWSSIGSTGDHLEITFEDQKGNQIKGLYFGANNLQQAKEHNKAPLYQRDPSHDVFVDVAYTLDIDHMSNDPQLIIHDLKPAKPEAIQAPTQKRVQEKTK